MTARTPGVDRGRPAELAVTPASRLRRRADLEWLGGRVRERRRAAGFTQESLSRALGISAKYLSLIERGGRNPPYATVVAIAHALGVAVSMLFEL